MKEIGSCMRNTIMEDAQGSYSHEEECEVININMGNVETESSGRRDTQEPVTMRRIQREVERYRDDNENIMNS
jgi:hypothetical protein